MLEIAKIFQNRSLDEEKLAAYGFTFTENHYTKNFPIMQGQFTAKISITADGGVDVRVYDSESKEEYVLAHVLNAAGAFVGEIHKACEAVLHDISQTCFYIEHFKEPQTKRLLHSIKEQYGAEPEFLWSRSPECAVLRIPGKKPWFALVVAVGKDKFGLTGGGTVEVINLKNKPEAVAACIDEHLAFPAYHMNKQHWYSIFLDDRLSDKEILSLIQTSYDLVNPKH